MCGIVAVSGSRDVIHDIYESLTVLQHRGQDASGILTNHKGKITLRKSLGLVRDGFSKKHIDRLRGSSRDRTCTLSNCRTRRQFFRSPNLFM